MGVVSCITNRQLEHKRAHVVVEANPHAIPLLQESRSRNQCEFEIVNAAIAYGCEQVTFTPMEDLWGVSLEQQPDREAVTVPAVQLRDIVRDHGFRRFTLVCDIEGHEYDLVKHESSVLQMADTIILETHARLIGEEKTRELLNKLQDLGFHIIDRDSFVLVMKQLPGS
jgi:FkbM family methyltransferase